MLTRLLEQRLDALERQFQYHCQSQNSHLASIDSHIEGLTLKLAESRVERGNQIQDLIFKINDLNTRILLAGLGILASAVLGLLWLVFGHLLTK